MEFGIFTEFTLIFLVAVVVSWVMQLLRQPLIIGYLLSGIIAGPFALNLVQSQNTVSAFAQMGIAFLLFMVGLNLNPRVIKDIGRVSLITGIGQVIFTSAIGFVICRALGFSGTASLYISVAVSFSSTIIIMKLLSDKKDLDALYGRISIGFLIVQDLIAIFILMFLSAPAGDSGLLVAAGKVLLRVTLLLIVLGGVSWYALPKITKRIAGSQELLLLFSVAWCLAIASAFYYFGFSIEAGALLAGITLSFSPYHQEISAKVKPLRDFFIILFFIMLGTQMAFSDVTAQLPSIIILSLFILVGNPLVVMALMGLLGYKKRTGFLAGLTVAQISEFSLVLVALGVALGHLDAGMLSVMTTVGLITIAGSSYLIIYSDRIYAVIGRYLSVFERKSATEQGTGQHRKAQIVLFGYNRIGFDVLGALKKIRKKCLVVDYDPKVIEQLNAEGQPCVYGDANDYELLGELGLESAKMIISTVPSLDTNLLLIRKISEERPKAIIAVVAHQIDDAIMLYEQGATYVIMPHFLGGHYLSTIIERNRLNTGQFLRQKAEHIKYLKRRKELGYEHPRGEKQQ